MKQVITERPRNGDFETGRSDSVKEVVELHLSCWKTVHFEREDMVRSSITTE